MTEIDQQALDLARQNIRTRQHTRELIAADRKKAAGMSGIREHLQAIAARELLRNRILDTQETPEIAQDTHPHTIYACGEAACSHTIIVQVNGEQTRQRRAVALKTLQRTATCQNARLVVVPCDVHGGEAFPTTETLRQSIGIAPTVEDLPQSPQPLPEPGA